MAETKEKKVTKISRIRARAAQGWKDVEKIANDVGASVGTVKVQLYKYYKENPDSKPVKVKKTPVKKAAKKE